MLFFSAGIWYNILSGMGKFSVIINVSINNAMFHFLLSALDKGRYMHNKCIKAAIVQQVLENPLELLNRFTLT